MPVALNQPRFATRGRDRSRKSRAPRRPFAFIGEDIGSVSSMKDHVLMRDVGVHRHLVSWRDRD